MKKSVVTTLRIVRIITYHGLESKPPGQAALDAMRKACHPVIGSIFPPPMLVTTGRNHAIP
jgi:hypothetical protein